MKKILYVGVNSGTCKQRYECLKELGNDVFFFPVDKFPFSNIIQKWNFKTGYLFFSIILNIKIRKLLKKINPDILWVNNIDAVNYKVIQLSNKMGIPSIAFNTDDPFDNNKKVCRWRLFKKTLKLYHTIVVFRTVNKTEALAMGAQRVFHTYMLSDEKNHKPPIFKSEEEFLSYSTEVLFIGTNFDNRDLFIKKLCDNNIPISIIGQNWNKSPYWNFLKKYWIKEYVDGEEYTKYIAASKISIGLLSKTNRDLHTTRSIEIPSIGGFFMAEDTVEHRRLYLRDKEAVFFDTPEECIDLCKYYLKHPEKISTIKKNGYERSQANGLTNQKILKQILKSV